jgi:hypothetical protein
VLLSLSAAATGGYVKKLLTFRMVYYKYAGVSGFNILEDLRLKITPPNEFNDPFEITPHSIFRRPLPQMIEEARTKPEIFRGTYDDMKRAGVLYTDSFDRFIAELPKALAHHYVAYRKLSKKELAKRDTRTLDNVSQKIGILCLSKPATSIPMWSYYADHHRGVVFGFDVNKISSRVSWQSGLVKYRKRRALVNPYLPPKSDAWRKQGFKMFFTKSIEWKHEQEYRRVFPLSELISQAPQAGNGKKYFLHLTGDAIREIIFGCRASDEFKDQICQELQRRKKTFGHIQLFRCERHTSKFELKIIPMTCNQNT